MKSLVRAFGFLITKRKTQTKSLLSSQNNSLMGNLTTENVIFLFTLLANDA